MPERALAACLLAAALGFLVLEPWHGPTVLALSEQHGVDAADLPALLLIALGLGVSASPSRAGESSRRWVAGAASAIVLGLLLLAGIFVPRIGPPLTPAGGGTFGRSTQHVDGRRAVPVGRWTHLAVTYDRATYRLYVDGHETSSRSASGAILSTTDPLWIGGTPPNGDDFRGVIDEVRVYSRAQRPSELRAAMSTPIARRHAGDSAGLVAAYGLDGNGGRTVSDASGNGNAGTIRGASWTSAGRFGPGLKFSGAGELVRVPASASLDLSSGMTLMAWIRPSASQSGWRIVVGRPPDAYFLTAGGGRQGAHLLERLDRLRFVLEILLLASLGLALVGGHALWEGGRWYWPVGLFMVGSLIDVVSASSNTLIGPTLVAIWWAATSSHREERASMCVLSAVFVAVTILIVVAPTAAPVPEDDGGVVRAAAVGLLLATASVLSLRRRPRASLLSR